MVDRVFDPDAMLDALNAHRVDFVVIGGIAAAILGAGWSTFDLDIVIATHDDNLARLADALNAMQSAYETFDSRRIEPDLARVRSLTGPQLLRTKHGRLDVLKEAGGETYESLSADAVHGTGRTHVVLSASVEALLRMKRAANRPKDREGIRLLEEALRNKKV